MKPTIEMTVDPKGRATVRTVGFAGASCREASRYLEEALGVRSSETLTAEFYQAQDATQRVEQRP